MMDVGFLFWFFLIGLIVASMQDLKRREVDNWLNLFLMIGGLVFLFYEAILSGDSSIAFQASFMVVVLFICMNLFYYGRVFAGGDAKLLFALTAFFVSSTFYLTLANLGVFLLLLMFAGSVYGLSFSVFLYFKSYEAVNKKMKEVFVYKTVRTLLFLGIIISFFGFINWMFLMIGVFMVAFSLLYVFAKGLELVSMTRWVSGEDLKEGDWLAEDVKVKGKVILATWDGLTLKELKVLSNQKRVKIKEGIPFVPSFLIAFIIYFFSRDYIFSFIMNTVR
jgi:Flp pilus assembly protein protease CpaA